MTWDSRRTSERAWVQVCGNPGPMTLDGTNTWVLAEPGSSEYVVIDPGPWDEPHLQAVLGQVTRAGGRVVLSLLTHGHADHAESAERFAELTGAPVRGAGAGPDPLTDGELIEAGGLELQVVATPGHTSDSVCFLAPAEQVLFTGDTILGRGTTVVAHPDGALAPYLDSLERIEALTGQDRVRTLAPGHGPVLPDAAAAVRGYREHRRQRLAQVQAAVAVLGEGEGELADRIVAHVYAHVPREVWPAARKSVLAQLDYLAAHG